MSSKPDIEDVLLHYGVHGRRKMVSCPLHQDNNPSCSVDYAAGVFHCFSCGEGGDSWTLIMKKEGVDFDGARALAASIGFGEGAPGDGGEYLSGTGYGGRRSVSGRAGDRPSRKAYVPAWRRRWK